VTPVIHKKIEGTVKSPIHELLVGVTLADSLFSELSPRKLRIVAGIQAQSIAKKATILPLKPQMKIRKFLNKIAKDILQSKISILRGQI
jgi:hypothetical protein